MDLRERLKNASRLPTPPGAALQILKLAQREDVTLGEVADMLAGDPALSLRILRYANSALVGVAREITSVHEAVVLLGMRSVRMMALSFSLVSSTDRRACPGFNYNGFWARSLAHAVAARHLATARGYSFSEEAFAAGLLAGIGKLTFAVAMPKEYTEILTTTGGAFEPTIALERERFGADFREAGAVMLEEWGIPRRLVMAVRHQCDPGNAGVAGDVRPLVETLNSARRCISLVQTRPAPQSPPALTDGGVAGGVAPAALAAMAREYRELDVVLGLHRTCDVDIDRIQAEAGEVLSQLSLAAELRSEKVEREIQGLQQQAFIDGLTGIANRAAFEKRFEEIWADTLRTGQPIAVAMLDIDHFKQFNDRYGHRTGDAVLQAVARCISPVLRKVDFVARYGGEEFVIVLPNADRLVAAGICVGVRRAVEEHEAQFEGHQHRVTISVGAALLAEPTNRYTRQTLIEAADQQLYRSKDKGRNCCSMKQLPRTPAMEDSTVG